jgi:hypothetical protein
MHHVFIQIAHEPADPADAFRRLCDIERMPGLSDAVLAVSREPDTSRSRWRVRFGPGELQWTQIEHVDENARRYSFTVVEGDVPTLSGSWLVDNDHGGARLSFEAEFDLGFPTLAAQLHPVAAQALIETVVGIARAALQAPEAVETAQHWEQVIGA